MKRLSINRVAGAGFRQNRRQYRALTLGIFLSVFLMLATLMTADGIYQSMKRKTSRVLGTPDAYLPDAYVDDETLFGTHLFKPEIGHVLVSARVADTKEYVGAYDAQAEKMLQRKVLEGRLPEQAGEAAIEEMAAGALKAKLGEKLKLSLLPLGGEAEERTFTVVGILQDQSGRFKKEGYDSGGVEAFPSVLVSEQELPMKRGRQAVHKLMHYAPGVGHGTALKYMEQHFGVLMYGIGANGDIIGAGDNVDKGPTMLAVHAGLIGGTLMISVGVGVSGAMSSILMKRTEEIAMLRAVGATKRQIRRIFGREAWLIALITTPPALLAACGIFVLTGRLFPEHFVFRPNPPVLGAAVVFSGVVLLVSAFFPLLRASRTYPMGVMRDTVLLRRMKTQKSRTRFSVPHLIAVRQLLARPSGMVGLSLLVSLLLVLTTVLANFFRYAADGVTREQPAYRISCSNRARIENFILKAESTRMLSAGDIEQMRALPLVKRVEVDAFDYVTLGLDKETDYVRPFDLDIIEKAGYPVTSTDREKMKVSAFFARPDTDESVIAFRETFGIKGKPLLCSVNIVSDLNSLGLPDVEAVDRAAVDEGRAVLLAVPDIYLTSKMSSNGERSLEETWDKPDNVIAVKSNNGQFAVGERLNLMRLTVDKSLPMPVEGGVHTVEALKEAYASANLKRAQPVIGHLIKAAKHGRMCLCTTEKGWQAMGFDLGSNTWLRIYLTGTPTPAEEEELTRTLEGIAARSDSATVENALKSERESAATTRQMMVVLAAVCILLFCVSASMATGQATRRIVAEQRLIGTLRAVGADQRTIYRCYLWPMLLNLLIGACSGLLISGTFLIVLKEPWRSIAETLPFPIIYALLLAACCMLLLRLRIRETMNKSVVENIREL